ncbi:MAG: (d)CMP kinase [Alphaproteobacteria bacterium]|nr:(d)CMP kinase [Alphaproteobacteria bacterium]
MPERPFAIAIDGPASSGKGTVARMVARALDFAYVDTGAMYRAVALIGARRGLALDDGPALGAMTDTLAFDLSWADGALKVVVDGEDLSEAIRTEVVGQGASAVAVLPEVRAALLGRQRALAETRPVVMDGRDIGTVVLPDAPVKVFLDARAEIRAARRQLELQSRGVEQPFDEVLADLRARDAQDSQRAAAPLRMADDGIYLDSSALTPRQVAAKVVDIARARGA